MILKINSDFLNLSDLLENLKDFNTLFYNNTLYVSSVKEFDININTQYIKSLIGDNCFITNITEHNLSFETSYVVDWCKNQFIQQDKIRYEQENQEKLNNIMSFLDNLEQEIFNTK